tara:strand:- start:391 stop:492 length:102 start_codon:yes stop_codon:yes gene_type:complete
MENFKMQGSYEPSILEGVGVGVALLNATLFIWL